MEDRRALLEAVSPQEIELQGIRYRLLRSDGMAWFRDLESDWMCCQYALERGPYTLRAGVWIDGETLSLPPDRLAEIAKRECLAAVQELHTDLRSVHQLFTEGLKA